MMVTINQIKKGLREYAVSQLFPRYGERSAKRVVVGSAIDLLTYALERPTSGFAQLFFSMTGVRDKEGLCDIDLLQKVLINNMPDGGTYDEFGYAGIKLLDLSFSKKDIDELVRHIVSA